MSQPGPTNWSKGMKPSSRPSRPLGTPTNAQLGNVTSHTTLLEDLPVLTIGPATVSGSEGTDLVLTLHLSAAAPEDIVVPLILGGTATAGDDYVIDSNPVIIPAGA